MATKQDAATQQMAEQERAEKERREQALELANERELRSNNPGTADQRQYAADAPGLHPANQPAPETRAKGTRLDLEDLTGNPGHKGVNPHAPATSINRASDSIGNAVPSINEPPGSEVLPVDEPRDDDKDEDVKTRRKR